MRLRKLPLLFVSAASFSCASGPSAPCPAAPAPAPALTASPADTCAVWDREVEFAQSVHDHDAGAFAEHVHPGAVFVGEPLLRGRDAVAQGWKGFIRGDKMRLSWHPTSVVVTGDPHVALSRGPYWIEVVSPEAKQRFLTGVFQSVWVKDTDGVWRVTIDGGTADPVPATEAEVEKIKSGIPTRCPGAGA